MPEKRGRPTSFKAAYCEQAKKLCQLGATDADIAAFFQVSIRTIARWRVDYDAFCQAIRRGKEQADDIVEQRLFQRATGYSHDAVKIMQYEGKEVLVNYVEHYPPDTTAAQFWLKNRRPELWRDAQRIEHTGRDGGPVETMDVSAREFIDRRIAGIAARGGVEGNTRKPH